MRGETTEKMANGGPLTATLPIFQFSQFTIEMIRRPILEVSSNRYRQSTRQVSSSFAVLGIVHPFSPLVEAHKCFVGKKKKEGDKAARADVTGPTRRQQAAAFVGRT